MSEARSRGTSIGVPRQELDEVVDIYANVLRKLILRVARSLDLYAPELQRIIDLVDEQPEGSQPQQLKGLAGKVKTARATQRSEEHTSELQSQSNLVCRLLLEKKKDAPPLQSVRSACTQSRS